MSSVRENLTPVSMRGYKPSWLGSDVIAGVTLSAVAIPEVLGYTSIAQTPLVTGLYTIIFPTMIFALLGASKLLVVGADSATAAILSAGLVGLSISGLTPYSEEWVSFCSLTALVCGAMLVLARILKLGFLGDFLSASVLVGFLTGVGIQVLTGQIPAMLGVPKGTGTWFQQQIDWIEEIPDTSWSTFAYAMATIIIILGFKRFAPRVPGALVAVVALTTISAVTEASANGVAVVGSLDGGFPPIGLPPGITWSDVPGVLAVAFSCFILIIAQSAATSRSFAMKHGDRSDINRDIVGLSGANFAAGLSGTFVVNGSPTKTQILDGQHGRTQIANLTMALIALIFTVWFTGLLADMPEAVLAGIVFLIGVELVDIKGLKRIWVRRRSECIIALFTALIVFAVGVEQGVVVAIILSILEIIRRAYRPKEFVITVSDDDALDFAPPTDGVQSLPGLLVFRYDAELFYANANLFVDDVQRLVETAVEPVRWLILDGGSLDDVDYSAGLALLGLIDYLHARDIVFAVARVDPALLEEFEREHVDRAFDQSHVYDTLGEAIAAFRADAPASHP